MAVRPSLSLLQWGSEHKPQLALVSSAGVVRFGTSIAYVMLTVVIARFYSESLSGIMIGVFNIYQALITDPIAGGLADRIGSKVVVALGAVLVGSAGLLWLFIPFDNLWLLSVFAVLLFTGYSFRDEVYTYILRMSGKTEGGMVFGIAENVFAVTTFISSLAIPYFVVAEHYSLAAGVMIVSAILSLLLIIGLPNDKISSQARNVKFFNPLAVIKRGWHFVKTNHYYPLLLLANSVFEGIFYGTIWLIMPLYIVSIQGGVFSGLTIGIYELITILAAGYAGYLADRYNWRKINAVGWTLAALGSIMLFFSAEVWWLVFIGAIIAVGNNLFAFAASHALEENDVDHQEDGAFIGLNNLTTDLCYGLAPLVVGFIYAAYGFHASLSLAVVVTCLLALITVSFAKRLSLKY